LQKAGGIAALAAAATYLFAMGLVFTLLDPMADQSLGFREYMAFLTTHKTLIFAWHSIMYLVNGCCLVVLVPAIYVRLRKKAPVLTLVASAFGILWTAFVLLSGLIVNYGTEAVIALYGKDPSQAEALKIALDAVTLGIDSSDRFLGGLWVGLASAAALRNRAFPAILNVFGLAISAAGLIATAVPALVSMSYLFGLGAIVWWLTLGVFLLKRETDARLVSV
jgi:hypothetical protein